VKWVDLQQLVQKLFPDRKDKDYEAAKRGGYAGLAQRPRPYRSWITSLIDGNKFGHDASKANRWLDAQIAAKVAKAGYDSVVLTAPELPASREIMIVKHVGNNIKFIKEYTV